jgi:hypothetical protein
MESEPAEDITLIEARIEHLGEVIERCRKIALASKLAISAGALWAVLMLLWLVPFYPGAMIGALAAMIGGIVLLGSNATTWAQTEASLRDSEAMRAEIIDRMALHTVDDGVRRLH